jgi:hypothetical protein
MDFGPLLLLFFVLAIIGGLIGRKLLSPEVRDRRRRRRSYGRPMPKGNRPMVKLTARVPKEKK